MVQEIRTKIEENEEEYVRLAEEYMNGENETKNINENNIRVVNEFELIKLGDKYTKKMIGKAVEIYNKITEGFKKDSNEWNDIWGESKFGSIKDNIVWILNYNNGEGTVRHFIDIVLKIEDVINTCNMISYGVSYKINRDTKLNDLLFSLQNKLFNSLSSRLVEDYRKTEVKFFGGKNLFSDEAIEETKLMPKEGIHEAMGNLERYVLNLIDKKDTMPNNLYIAEATKVLYRFLRIHPFSERNDTKEILATAGV